MKGRSAAVRYIFVTVVLDVIAMGIIIPVLPSLIREFLQGDTVQAATMYGVFGTVWALMQFVCSPIIGMLSDRFGRRRIILLANFGLGLDYIVMALAPSIGWLFLGRIVSGITGASWTTAGAYIADVTPHDERAKGYGVIGAAWGVGFVLGPALGGVLGGVDPRLPFWAAAAMTLTNAAYGLFLLPESLPPEKRRAFEWKRANPVGSLTLLRSHHELLGLSAVNAIYFLAHQAMPSVFVLYAGYRYGWGPRAVGFTLAVVGVCTAIVQGGFIHKIVKRFGERRALLAGLAFGTMSYLGWAIAPTGWFGLLAIPFGAMMGLYSPSAQGLMSKRVSASEQGQLQGANASIMGITGMIGPSLFTMTFARFIDSNGIQLPGAPYFLGALLCSLAFMLAWRVTRAAAARPEPQLNTQLNAG